MGNPFNIGPFNCCSCPEPPDFDAEVDDPMAKYINMCGCPTVAIFCVSEEKIATLCGKMEFQDLTADPPVLRSSPPAVYKSKEVETVTVTPSVTTSFPQRCWQTGITGDSDVTTIDYTATAVTTSRHFTEKTVTSLSTEVWDTETCSSSTSNDPVSIVGGVGSTSGELDCSSYNGNNPPGCGPIDPPLTTRGAVIPAVVPDDPSDLVGNALKINVSHTFVNSGRAAGTYEYTSSRQDTETFDGLELVDSDCGIDSRSTLDIPGYAARYSTTTTTTTLSLPDSEEEALARATAKAGSDCSSIDELRTDSYDITQRTATYTATASNLVIGVPYKGCVRLRRRKAYSGTTPLDPETEVTEVIAWEDVEPDTIAPFTPTETSEEVATDEALPTAKGYEYQAVSAHVWPVSAGCDCPTSYVTP
jgi:hypothetical protein